MNNIFSLFEQVLMEADEPPDINMDNNPPDDTTITDAPELGESPDINDDISIDDNEGDAPSLDSTEDDGSFDMSGTDNGEEENPDLGLDDKVSNVLNMGLYQKYLSMLNNINTNLSMIKTNNDMFMILIPDASINLIDAYNKLESNIRLYLKNYFMNRNYSVNLLFFNKCLNLLKLLNDSFTKNINKAIKSVK